MTILGTLKHREARFTPEGGGWLAVRQRQPALDGRDPAELLARAVTLPGNLRYVADRDGKVFLSGEVRSVLGGEEAQQRLLRWLEPASSPPPAAGVEEALEAALEASGMAWSRREKSWAVPANTTLPRELQISLVPGGVRVEAILAEWDEIGDVERRALAQFLLAAQAGLRFARCELDERRARVVALSDAEQIDGDLPHALLGVAAGCRLLAREAAALLLPDAAGAYLEFHGSQGGVA